MVITRYRRVHYSWSSVVTEFFFVFDFYVREEIYTAFKHFSPFFKPFYHLAMFFTLFQFFFITLTDLFLFLSIFFLFIDIVTDISFMSHVQVDAQAYLYQLPPQARQPQIQQPQSRWQRQQ